MDAELIAPCGMNCGICSSFLARQYDIRRRGIKMPYCTGCRPRGKLCAFIKKPCEALMCGRFDYCYQCHSFPCRNLSRLDARYRQRYHMSMVANLEYIKAHGITAFLAQEQEKWACPGCGGVISCHNGICYQCGAEILLTRKKWYSWDTGEAGA